MTKPIPFYNHVDIIATGDCSAAVHYRIRCRADALVRDPAGLAARRLRRMIVGFATQMLRR